MSESYLGGFGLKAAPSSKEIADSDLWLPTSKSNLVDELCEAVAEHASVLRSVLRVNFRSLRESDLP